METNVFPSAPNDHRTDAENVTIATAIAGDQIRTFDEAKRFACKVNVAIYNEQTADYWYKYYNGVKIDENTHLGGSMVFNLADMANMLGVPYGTNGNGNDIYKAIYTTFGTLQSKYYSKDLPTFLEYGKVFDKSILMSVIGSHPELLEGKANITDYSTTTMTNKIGNKIYHIEFQTGSSIISESSKSELNQIFQDATTADGTKILVSGYTDNVGNPESNQSLSEQRAQAVLQYLVSKGLVTSRLKSEGHGQNSPAVPNTTPANKAKNRRVVISVYSK